MKHTTLAAERLTLRRLLANAARDRAVFLTLRSRVRFVLLPADDGDQEVCALGNNSKFMAYLEDCIERARTGKTKTLAAIRAKYGPDNKTRGPASASRHGSRSKARRTA
jgi:hypothetical protein